MLSAKQGPPTSSLPQAPQRNVTLTRIIGHWALSLHCRHPYMLWNLYRSRWKNLPGRYCASVICWVIFGKRYYIPTYRADSESAPLKHTILLQHKTRSIIILTAVCTIVSAHKYIYSHAMSKYRFSYVSPCAPLYLHFLLRCSTAPTGASWQGKFYYEIRTSNI